MIRSAGMQTMSKRWWIAAALLLAAACVQAQSAWMDPGFGLFGWRWFGFPTVNDGGNSDLSYASCPGPGTSAVVAGASSGGMRLSVLRLRADGTQDPAYGTVHHPLALNGADATSFAALCLGSGRILIAREAKPVPGGASVVQLVLIGGDGQLDPAFGSGGVAQVDFGAVSGIPADGHYVKGLNRASDGEILLSASVSRITPAGLRVRAAVARLSAGGALRDARVYELPQLLDLAEAVTLEYAPQGQLWMTGHGKRTAGSSLVGYFAQLDPATLAVQDLRAGAEGLSYQLGNGRMVRPGVLVQGGLEENGSNGELRPVLIVHRAAASQVLRLPVPLAPDQRSAFTYGTRSNVLALPGHKVLLGDQLGTLRTDGAVDMPGWYLALAYIGATAQEDRIETRFGSGGGMVYHWDNPDPSCAVVASHMRFSRLSLWNGRAVVNGYVYGQCSPYRDLNWLIGRLELDYLFADGLQG